MTPFFNATLRTTRAGTEVYANRRVQLERPTRAERSMAPHAEVALQVYDVAGADYSAGDVLYITALDGHGAPPLVEPSRAMVMQVSREAGALPLVRLVATGAPALPERCDVLRLQGGVYAEAGALASAQQVAQAVPARVTPQPMEEYPTPAIPNQPQTRWHVMLDAEQDVRNNDILSFDDGQRLYVVLRSDNPLSLALATDLHCVLSATSGQLGDAYLRPNGTVLTTRAGWTVYSERRVHLIYPQVNPASAIERLQGGVATLRIGLIDLVDADIQQGDSCTVLSEDGASVLPGVRTFTVAAAVRRPLPFAAMEIDLLADIL